MSFPLNRIFQDYSSYNIEYKLFNYEYGNIRIQMLLPLGHISNMFPKCHMFKYFLLCLCALVKSSIYAREALPIRFSPFSGVEVWTNTEI